MSVTTQDRQRLDQIRARVHNAREAVQNAEAVVRGAGGDSDVRQAGETALATARTELESAMQLQSVVLSQIAGLHLGRGGGVESVLDNPQTIETLQQVAGSNAPIGSMMLGSVVGRDDLIGRIRSGRFDPGMMADASTAGVVDFAAPTDPARGQWLGIQPQIRRRLQILAAIPTGTMDRGSFSYTQEYGSFGGPAETAENATAPAAQANFEDAECVAQAIPAWLKVPRDQLADVPQLQTALTQRLTYGCLRRVEDQIVAGDGTGQNLRGILNTTGIATVAFDADEPLSDLTLDAITTVLVSDAVPDLAIFNPLDLAAMLKTKADGSGVRLDSDGAFAPTANTIWDLPRVASTAIAQGKALVGDFALGATLFIRSGVDVRISDSDQDDFLKRRVTLLGETRVGLAVWNPTCFCEVSLSA